MLGLLALCGCNQAFDLKSTKLADPHPDAAVPAACPAIGNVPRFSDDMKQIPPRSCDGYTVSEHDTAMAMCRDPQGVTWLLGGAADAELSNVITMDMPYQYDLPRLAPDGDRLFISHAETGATPATSTDQIIEFAWSGTTVSKMASYTAPHDYQYGAEYFEISTPSRGPDHHIVYSDYNYTSAITELVEIADGSGAFKEVARYPITELGDTMTAISRPSLSPDGLRLVFLMYDYLASGGGATGGGATTSGGGTDLPPGGVIGGGGLYCQGGGNVVMYADRATTADHFSKAVAMETLPNMVDYPYMTEDCGRIYVSALNRVFYFKQ